MHSGVAECSSLVILFPVVVPVPVLIRSEPVHTHLNDTTHHYTEVLVRPGIGHHGARLFYVTYMLWPNAMCHRTDEVECCCTDWCVDMMFWYSDTHSWLCRANFSSCRFFSRNLQNMPIDDALTLDDSMQLLEKRPYTVTRIYFSSLLNDSVDLYVTTIGQL